MGWLIALAALVLLSFIPIGVRAVYREDKPGIWLLIGPVKYLAYPGKPKEEKPKVSPQKQKTQKTYETGGNKQKGGSLSDFQPVLKTVFDFLCQFRRKLRINHLELKLVLAGGDPCDLALNYGKAWAILGNLMPQLERFLVIKKRNLEVECDFAGDKTRIFARADATITIGRTLHLLSYHGVKVLKELLKLKKTTKRRC